MSVEAFFAFARERHAIYLRRRAGLPGPWTTDPILNQYRFTNVFRELDRTTVWFREHVRDPMRDQPEVLLATVLFRWFNRITTGEAIFSQKGMLSNSTIWDYRDRMVENDGTGRWIKEMHNSILTYCGRGPYVTGSYIIKTPDGYDKLSGVLKCLEWFMEQEHDYPGDASMGWRGVAEILLASSTWDDPAARFGSLEQTWAWMRQFPYMGDFMAYEVVTDLRHTALLDWAPDIMTWANAGPGATRGLGRVFHDDPQHYRQSQKYELKQLMQELLAASQSSEFWPQLTLETQDPHYVDSDDRHVGYPGDWPSWEMRDVEHTLCEFDKYERTRLGEGRPRGVYHHG